MQSLWSVWSATRKQITGKGVTPTLRCPAGMTDRVGRFCRTRGTATMYYMLSGYTFGRHK
jgi:hypothetical protein